MPSERVVHRTEIDGVPVLWTPGAPRFIGALWFRVGTADETLLTSGMTHLVEHLALHGLGTRQAYAFNGQVEAVRTGFYMRGEPAEAVEFMRHVCRGIADLPLDRLTAERRVLQSEATGRGQSLVALLRYLRYGNRGHGIGSTIEFALHGARPEHVTGWAHGRFVAGNAAALFSGPLPDGLSFEALPRGPRHPCPEPRPVPGVRWPACTHYPAGGVAVSFVADRRGMVPVILEAASRRLNERLRFEDGIIYGVQTDYVAITAEEAHAVIHVPCSDDHAPRVRDEVLRVLREFRDTGPTSQELGAICDGYERAMADPEWILGQLDYRVTAELYGREPESDVSLLKEMRSLTPEACAETVRRAWESALVVLPPGCDHEDGELHRYPVWSEEPVDGRVYRSVAERFPWSRERPKLVVGDDGVSVVTPKAEAITVLHRDAVGAVLHPGRVLELFGADGFMITLAESEWRGGSHALDRALHAIPAERLLLMPGV